MNAFLQTKARQYPNLAVIGRRKPGVTWQQAQAEMSTIAARLASAYPGFDGGVGIRIVPLRQQLSERVGQGIVMLWGAILGVLLIACLNTASLLIGRTAGRRKEIALRLSLGASWRRLARQLLTESLSLCLGGRLIGSRLGRGGRESGLQAESGYRQTQRHAVDFRVLGYTAAVTASPRCSAAYYPRATVPSIDVNRALKENAGSASPATHSDPQIADRNRGRDGVCAACGLRSVDSQPLGNPAH